MSDPQSSSPQRHEPHFLMWFPMGFLVILGVASLIQIEASLGDRLFVASAFGIWSAWFVRRRRRRLHP